MTWRPYAAGVAISAGVFVTGVLWYDRANPHIAAEDVAALAADLWERDVAFFTPVNGDISEAFRIAALGPSSGYGDILDYPSNYVSTVRARETLERITYGLKRHLIPSWPNTGVAPYITSGEGPVHWLPDDTCFTGDTNPVGESATLEWTNSVSIDYYGVERREWTSSVGRATALPLIITLDTRDTTADKCYDFTQGQRHVPGISDLGLSGQYGDLGLDGANSWWEAAGMGELLYVWPHFETAGPYIPEASEVTYAHHRISTNTLNDVRTVMSGMKTAVLIAGARNNEWWICGTNSFSIPNTGYQEFKGRYSDSWGSFGVPSVWSNQPPSASFYTGPVQDLQDEVESWLNDPARREPCPGPVNLPFTLYEYVLWRRIFLDYYESAYGNPPGINKGYIASVVAKAGFAGFHLPRRGMLSELRCAWPSPWMYTNGLVSRVRYYAVFGPSPTGYPVLPAQPHTPPISWFSNYILYTNHYVDSWSFSWASTPLTTSLVCPEEDIHFGYKVSYGAGPPLPLVSSSIDGYDEIYYSGAFEGPPSVWWPVLLADETSPTSAPVVDIGTADNLYVGPEMVTGVGQATTEYTYDLGYNYREANAEGGNTARSLAVWALICVVDFNFTDYRDGGKGELFTPPWATNAPAYTP